MPSSAHSGRRLRQLRIIVIASAIERVVNDLVSGAIGGLSYGPFLASAAAVIIIALGVLAPSTRSASPPR